MEIEAEASNGEIEAEASNRSRSIEAEAAEPASVDYRKVPVDLGHRRIRRQIVRPAYLPVAAPPMSALALLSAVADEVAPTANLVLVALARKRPTISASARDPLPPARPMIPRPLHDPQGPPHTTCRAREHSTSQLRPPQESGTCA